MPSSRPREPISIRSVVIGVCFLWGLILGYTLYFFRDPAPPYAPPPPIADPIPQPPAEPPPLTVDRTADSPPITAVDVEPTGKRLPAMPEDAAAAAIRPDPNSVDLPSGRPRVRPSPSHVDLPMR